MSKTINKKAIETLVEIFNGLKSHSIAGQGEGWVYMADYGSHLKSVGFNIAEYGYNKLVNFVKTSGIFTIYTDNSKAVPVNHIRLSVNTTGNDTLYYTRSRKSSESPLDNPQLMGDLKEYYKALADAEICPEIVGFYEQDRDGNYQFSDIRDTLFQEHKYPSSRQNDDREIIIRLDGPINNLKLNTYYKFNWIVKRANNSRGYILDIDKSKCVRKIKPKDLTNRLHELWDDRSHGAAMNAAMETISSELMASSDGTFIFELLQNANDYPKKEENGRVIPVEVEFHMTGKCLICRHSGSAFSPRDVASICSIGNGSKTKNKNAIGYKGIGFKTVFHAHDWVYVKTGDYSFRFDKSHEREGRPFQIMPIWTPDQDLSAFDSTASTIVHEGEHDFSVQTIMMPRKLDYLYGMDKNQESEKSHEYVLRDMFKDIRDIVFIPNIKTVKVFFPNEEPIVCSKGESLDWVISAPYVHRLDNDTERKEIIDECDQHPERRIPPKYKSFEDTYVSFAAKKEGNVILPVEDATVNCYLPTKAEFGFPFLMNTDMVPSGDRNQLKLDIKFNQLLARIAGQKFVSWISQLLTDGYEPESVLNLIPDFNSIKDGVGKQYKVFIECFEEGFKTAVKSTPIIPVEGTKELQLPSKVLRDVTGFSAKKIISHDKFLEYSGHKDLFLPLASICSNERLIEMLNKSDDCIKFNDPNLVNLFANTSFRDELLNIDVNAKVVEFLLNYKYRDNYKDLSLFIDHVTGSLSKSSDLFLNIDDDRKYLSAYENQLAFLSTKTREILKSDSSEQNNYIEKLKSFKWADYTAYRSVIKPLFEISSRKSDNLALLKNCQTNLDMFKFIGKHQIKEKIVKSFPVLLSDGQYGTLEGVCYFFSSGAIELSGSRWVDKSWYSVLSQAYDKIDTSSDGPVKMIFEYYGVQGFSNRSFYERVIKNNNTHIDQINEISSSDFSICLELLKFLFSIWNEKEIGSFNHFLLPVVGKNGCTSYVSGKNVPIFLYDQSTSDTMSALLNKNWIAEGWGYILDSRCQSSLISIGFDNVNKILKEKFSIKDPTTECFCQNVVVKNIAEIIKDITPVYKSEAEPQDVIDKRGETRIRNLDFFKFVCENYSSIFAKGFNPFHDSGYPFCLCNNEKYSNKPSKYYNYSKQALEAASQDWLPTNIMGVIDKGYAEITSTFNGAKELYTLLRVSDFTYASFLKEDVSSNKGAIMQHMDGADKSISFHSYFKANRNSFSPDDREALKNFPVYIVSDESSQMVKTSTGLHIINDQVTELAQAGFGTVGTMDMILADYFDDKKADSEYWIDILGNKEFTFPEIAAWMITRSKEVIAQKTAELDGNISFWRIVKKLPGASNKDNQKSLRSLRIFPIYLRIVKEESPAIKVLDSTEQCYVSDSYFVGGGGVEYMLKEYADSSSIVTGVYLEDSSEETLLSWKKFWESAGFLSSNEELVMNTIIPNLDKPENQNEKIPLLLFQNKAIIDKTLSNAADAEGVEKLIGALNKLYIKTKGGLRKISEAYFVQKNDYAPYVEPMAYMPLLTQVFEYTDEQYSFFMSIGERAGSKIIKDQTAWRLEKIKQFASLQNTSGSEENKLSFDFKSIHYPFIEDLSEWFSTMNSLEYGSYYRNIKLYDRNGNLCQPSTLTEGSVYSPYCDFESCGLTDLNYISDEYSKFKNIRFLLSDMGVHYFFWKEDIPLLENKNFAVYFWNKYMADSEARMKVELLINEGAFKNIKCVPTAGDVKSAEELYNTFGTFGKEDLSSYVNLLKDGNSLRAEGIVESFKDLSDESRTYSNPICKLDFVCVLSKNHCFEYLMNSKVENTAKRRYVLNLLLEYQHEGKVSDEDIESYRSSEYAKWLNGKKESAHISTLYAIGRQLEDKYFLRHFGSSPLIINNDTISDDDASFEDICTNILKIKVLHGGDDSNFITKPSAASLDETTQIRQSLNQKSLLLATIINAPEGEEWKAAYDKYVSDIATLNFVKCDSIAIECKENPGISKSDVDAFFYDKSNKTFYYLKDWQHKFVFDSMWRKLIEVLDIPGGDDEMTIKKILDKDLESQDVDCLIEEYCTNFYEDENFIKLLSSLYPETSGRLNIKRATSADETQPQKLVGFSEDRKKGVADDSKTAAHIEAVGAGENIYEKVSSTAESQSLESKDSPIQNEKSAMDEKPTKTSVVSSTLADGSAGEIATKSDNLSSEKPNEADDSVDQDDNEDVVIDEDDERGETKVPKPGAPTGIIMKRNDPVYADDEDRTSLEEDIDTNEDDDEDDEPVSRVRRKVQGDATLPEPPSPKPSRKGVNNSAYKGQWEQAQQDSPVVRKRRNYSGYSPDKFKTRQFNAGTQEPLTLSRRDIDKDEVQYLSNLFGRALNIDTIKDENYIVRMRFYNSLKENGLEMDMSERDYIEHGSSQITTKSGKYVHRCSARSGILYISPTVWNRLREGRWVICFYSGKMADQFVYVRTQDELMEIINQDALVIQVTGNNKQEMVDKIYEDGFSEMEGNIYTLIRTIKVEGEVTPFDENVTDYFNDDDDQDTDEL